MLADATGAFTKVNFSIYSEALCVDYSSVFVFLVLGSRPVA